MNVRMVGRDEEWEFHPSDRRGKVQRIPSASSWSLFKWEGGRSKYSTIVLTRYRPSTGRDVRGGSLGGAKTVFPKRLMVVFSRRGGTVEWNKSIQFRLLLLGVQTLHVHFLLFFRESSSNSLIVVGSWVWLPNLLRIIMGTCILYREGFGQRRTLYRHFSKDHFEWSGLMEKLGYIRLLDFKRVIVPVAPDQYVPHFGRIECW